MNQFTSLVLFSFLVTALLTALATESAYAGPDCGGGDPTKAEDKQKWMAEADLQKKLADEGYKIKKFKTSGNCYEIYGWNKAGEKVEIYFNPLTGAPVKTIKK